MLNVHIHVKYMDFVWHFTLYNILCSWMKPAECPLVSLLLDYRCTKVHAWQFSCHGNYKWCIFTHRGTENLTIKPYTGKRNLLNEGIEPEVRYILILC